MAAVADDLARRLLGQPSGALGEEERHVVAAMTEGRAVARDAADLSDERADLGDRLADRVAAVGGSWGFIIVFAVVLVGWMLLNTDVLAHWGRQFDPYPYVFLNLMLSTLAAIQAPIIMMSQNRQAAKDRLAARLDYETNLHSELEILRLHQKLDGVLLDRLAALEAKIDRIGGTSPDGASR